MKTSHQVLRFIQKIAAKFPAIEEPTAFTDIHVRVSQESGDIMAFDDDEREITRCVVEEWINAPMETDEFYSNVINVMRPLLDEHGTNFGIIKPYNFVLENESGEHIAELYVVDDSETTILGTPFMQDLDEDLDNFIENLLKDE